MQHTYRIDTQIEYSNSIAKREARKIVNVHVARSKRQTNET